MNKENYLKVYYLALHSRNWGGSTLGWMGLF